MNIDRSINIDHIVHTANIRICNISIPRIDNATTRDDNTRNNNTAVSSLVDVTNIADSSTANDASHTPL